MAGRLQLSDELLLTSTTAARLASMRPLLASPAADAPAVWTATDALAAALRRVAEACPDPAAFTAAVTAASTSFVSGGFKDVVAAHEVTRTAHLNGQHNAQPGRLSSLPLETLVCILGHLEPRRFSQPGSHPSLPNAGQTCKSMWQAYRYFAGSFRLTWCIDSVLQMGPDPTSGPPGSSARATLLGREWTIEVRKMPSPGAPETAPQAQLGVALAYAPVPSKQSESSQRPQAPSCGHHDMQVGMSVCMKVSSPAFPRRGSALATVHASCTTLERLYRIADADSIYNFGGATQLLAPISAFADESPTVEIKVHMRRLTNKQAAKLALPSPA